MQTEQYIMNVLVKKVSHLLKQNVLNGFVKKTLTNKLKILIIINLYFSASQ